MGVPFAAPDLEPSRVAALFDRNAARYDAINAVMTFGLDAAWRRWAARRAVPRPVVEPPDAPPRPARVLDACAGTGLLARDLLRRGATVTAADASSGMLAVARERLAGAPGSERARLVAADLSSAAAVAALGGPFDAITLGFGLRYVVDPAALLALLRSRLAENGRLVVVEAVRPPRDALGRAAALYFFEVAPRIGTALAGRAELYEFLTASTRALGTAEDVVAHLGRAGLAVTVRRRFAGGAVAGLVALPSSSATT